jgi:WD40 repeat protein
VQAVAYSPDGARIVSASRDRTARIFDAVTGEVETTYPGNEAPLLQAVWNSKGEKVITLGAHQRALQAWGAGNVEKPENLGREAGGGGPVIERFALAKAGLVTLLPGGVVQVVQLADKQPLFTLYGHRDSVQSVALAPKTETIATGGYAGEVCVWDLACGTWRQRFVAVP